jgi:LysM repeat protein
MPYKTYVVKRYKHWDILCDPYTVQKGDYIWQLLRRRGCIIEWDLAWYTALLKRLNPHLGNVNKIYPGQEILIPLKRMDPEEGTTGEDERLHTIPFLPDMLHSTYTIRPGDYVAKIAAERQGFREDQIPEEYLQAVKELNPGIENLNRIYPGQKIRIPDIGPGGRLSRRAGPARTSSASLTSRDSRIPPAVDRPFERQRSRSGISGWVEQIGGKVIQSGYYFFPVQGKEDFKLDLEAFPVIELEGGRRILLDTGKGLSEDAQKAIRAFWKPLTIVRTEPWETRRTLLDKVFRTIHGGEVQRTVEVPMSGDGIHVTLRGDWILHRKGEEHSPRGYDCITMITNPEEKTSVPLKRYLTGKNIWISDLLPDGVHDDRGVEEKRGNPPGLPVFAIPASNHENYVENLVKGLGYSYDRQVPLSFQYAGFQVQTVANLMHGEGGLDVVVDFGTLFGDAKGSIEKSGLKVITIESEDKAMDIARKLMQVMGVTWTKDPVLFGADRDVFKTTSVEIPGLLASPATQGKTLLTLSPLPMKMCEFLKEKEIIVVKIRKR